MRARRGGAAAGLVLAAVMLSSACASFTTKPSSDGSDAGDGRDGTATEVAACPTPTCTTESPACRPYDFADPSCPDDWKPSGDGIVDCAGGSARIDAEATSDAHITLKVDTPAPFASITVSMIVTIDAWNQGVLLELSGANRTLGAVVAGDTLGGVGLQLCPTAKEEDAPRCLVLGDVTPKQPHLLVLEMNATALSLTVDCAPVKSIPGAAPKHPAEIEVDFGRDDGDRAIGSIDDVVVRFR